MTESFYKAEAQEAFSAPDPGVLHLYEHRSAGRNCPAYAEQGTNALGQCYKAEGKSVFFRNSVSVAEEDMKQIIRYSHIEELTQELLKKTK